MSAIFAAMSDRQFSVFEVGGDVFSLSVEIADQKVLASKHFTSDERHFFTEHLQEKCVEISSKENVQIWVKVSTFLWGKCATS